MRGLILAALVGLSACVGTAPGGAFRTEGAQIASAAAFDPLRFQGRWYEVAGFHTGKCAVGAVTFAKQVGPVMNVTEGPCADARARMYTAQISGPGRLSPDDGSAPLWVLWVDEGYRTAVIGTPSGAFGYVLNRTRDIPTDRLNAAREVLDFNGYDTAKLRASGL